jgi:hypothetical protein
MDIALTKYDIVCGIIFFIINIIYLFTNTGMFNNMNKYSAFLIISILSILYTFANRILYQYLN